MALRAGMAEWQTRRSQTPLAERSCGFESHSRYHRPHASVRDSPSGVRSAFCHRTLHARDNYRGINIRLQSTKSSILGGLAFGVLRATCVGFGRSGSRPPWSIWPTRRRRRPPRAPGIRGVDGTSPGAEGGGAAAGWVITMPGLAQAISGQPVPTPSGRVVWTHKTVARLLVRAGQKRRAVGCHDDRSTASAAA